MDLLAGETLAQRLPRERPLPPGEAAAIARGCAEGLAVAHDKGVVHRDLKPDNVFIARGEGGRVVAKLLDFGVAKVVGASKGTRKGMTFGTPRYMSPEQATGGPIDGRADLYALGIILYECIAGAGSAPYPVASPSPPPAPQAAPAAPQPRATARERSRPPPGRGPDIREGERGEVVDPWIE